MDRRSCLGPSIQARRRAVCFENLNDEAGVAPGDRRQGAGGKGVPGKRVPEGVRGVRAAQKPEDAGGRRGSAPDDVTAAPRLPVTPLYVAVRFLSMRLPPTPPLSPHATPFPPAPRAEPPKRSPPPADPPKRT